MKSTPVGKDTSVQNRSRWSRLVVAVAGLMLSVNGAFAQTYGVSTFAGASFQPANTDTTTGPATAARFNTPKGIATDSAGNVYVADSVNNAIRKIAVTTGITSTIATGLSNPSGIAVDSANNLYVANTGAHTILKIVGTTVTTLAGSAGSIGLVDNATGTTARFFNPTGIAVNSAGTIAYVADTGNNLIRRIDLTGTIGVSTIAGTITSGSGVAGSDNNASGLSAKFNSPYALALDAGGANLFVADRNNHSIRLIALTGTNAVSTFAGTSGTSGTTDSPALFKNPEGIAITAGGALFVADAGNATVRSITSAGAVSTIAGTAGQLGSTDGVSTAARFQEPFGVALLSSGVVYVADAASQVLRRLEVATAPTVTTPVGNPANFTVASGGTLTLTTTYTGSPAPTFVWQRQPAAGGGFSALTITSPYSVSTTGTTATLTITGVTGSLNGDQFRVVASNGVAPDATSSPVTLVVNQPPTMANSTTSANFAVDVVGTFTFTASGSPAPDLFIFSGNYPGGASLSQTKSGTTTTGQITWTPSASQAASSPYIFTVRANNGVGTEATQAFTFNVAPAASAPIINTQPTDFVVPLNQTSGNPAFSVGASGNPAISGYQWQKRQSDLSTFANLANDGIYSNVTTAALSINSISPAMNGDVFRVLVSNTSGTTVSNNVTLVVSQSPAITSTSTTHFIVGQNNSFTFTASGVPTPTINVAGTLPSGVTYLNGVLSGTPLNADITSYALTVTATNSAGTSFGQAFTLTVGNAAATPAISVQPVSVVGQLTGNATFTATATGSPTPSLRWQRQPSGTTGFVDLVDDGTYSGTTTGTLTVINIAAGMTGDQFRLVASNVNGSVASTIVALTVNVGTSITTFAGTAGLSGATDALGVAARFSTPAGIAADPQGNFYVADAANNVIRKINTAGVVTTLAGQAGTSGNVDGVGSSARFNGPSAVTVDSIGNVYVADTYNHTIRAITPAGSVSTLAGSPNISGSADGVGNLARFSFPSGIVVDAGANIYVSDTSNHTIRRVLVNGTVSTFAGVAGAPGNANGNGNGARFQFPNGLAVDSVGNVYVADAFNHVIRRITPAADVSTLAGSAGLAGSTDGNGSTARFNQPQGVAVDSSGNVYVADTYSHTIRKIASNAEVTTLAGSPGVSGSADGLGSSARFNQPFSIAVDVNGNFYIADTRNNTIRRSGTTSAPGIVTQPANFAAVPGGSATFTVVASGIPAPSYQWQRQPIGGFTFSNLTNDGIHSGVNTATLTILNVLTANEGDQYRVVVNNGISPTATSNAATLTMGVAPVITSAASATFRATEAGTFTVTASGTPAPTFTVANAPAWLTLNATSGVLSGTPPSDAVGTLNLTLTATNGGSATQSFVLTVVSPVVAPTFTLQPVSQTVNQGSDATFTVTVSGTAPFTYQWRRNGQPIAGATTASYTVANAQPSSAALYSVAVTNQLSTVLSNAAGLSVNTPPVFTMQPQTQTAQAGSSVTFSVAASGGGSFSYQWRKNGIAIPGATNGTLTLNGVNAGDAGNYDVLVTSPLGSLNSSLAQLNIVTGVSAPVITSQPAPRTALVGGATSLTVGATGAPAPSYQWRKNGVNIAGANSATLAFSAVQASDAANYDVVVSSSAGSVTSLPAGLRVLTRSYAGYYFGTFSGGVGSFALYVRDDNSAVFLGYIPGNTAPVVSLNLSINDNGQFVFTQGGITTSAANEGEPARAAALAAVVVSGSIASDNTLSGSIQGGANASLSATRSTDGGQSQGVAGFYQAGSPTNGAISYAIAGPANQAFAITQSGTGSDGGSGAVSAAGQVSVVTSRSVISQSINSTTGTVTGSSTGAVSATFSGGSDAANARQRLVNISSRARVAAGDAVAIAGFVISGEESKPVLIRAVGPTLGTAPFNVGGALASPRLELFRGSTSLAVNAGIGANRLAIDAAGAQAGAFALGAAGNDAAILTTLAPGNYTAIVSSTTAAAGVALVEVYDLSAAAPGQKLINIATRAAAGAGDNLLIAGFVVPPGTAKRVLVRAVGPGLTPLGVTGVLAQPTLVLFNGAQATVAQNANWRTSPDADLITTASASVGAFGLATNDSAIVVTLAPGNYTAQVLGNAGATGIALIEVYELP